MINRPISKNNKSGTTGVFFRKRMQSWVAKWKEGKKDRSKSFSLKKYGSEAKQIAINYRMKKIKKLSTYKEALLIDKPVTPTLDNIEYENRQRCIKRRVSKTNKSGRSGLMYKKSRKCWIVRFLLNGKRKEKQFGERSRKNGFNLAKQEAIYFQDNLPNYITNLEKNLKESGIKNQ